MYQFMTTLVREEILLDHFFFNLSLSIYNLGTIFA